MKKKLFLIITLLAATENIFGQDRHIVMPPHPVDGYNIAEKDNGYWCAFEIGGGSTTMENMQNIAMVTGLFTNGYRFNQYIKIGAGFGVLYYPNNKNVRDSDSHFSIPVFLNIRGNILPDETRRIVPFWSANIGASISDGFFFTPAVGLRIGEKRSAFLVSVAYTLRHLDTYPKCKSNYNGVFFRLGYEF